MENWCYDRQTLYSFARHYQTGEPLPEDMFKRLKAAKTFRSGTMMLRQVSRGLAAGLRRWQGSINRSVRKSDVPVRGSFKTP